MGAIALPVTAQIEDEVYSEDVSPDESGDESGDDSQPFDVDLEDADGQFENSDPTGDTFLEEETNPLNPLGGQSFEMLLRLQINDDTWQSMLDPLPCLEATEVCIRELQELAVGSSFTLRDIDERIELVNEQIEIARSNNQQSIRLGIFEPFIQEVIRLETVSRIPNPDNQPVPGSIIRVEQEGFLERIGRFFGNSSLGINTLLSFIGLPLFRSAAGGDAATQNRQIAIADLQVKVAEVERQRGEMANALRERVLLDVLEFETTRREFQGNQEIARRSQLRLDVLELNYRFTPDVSTHQYLGELNTTDGIYLNMFRQWAQMRTQLTQIKIVVLGAEGF